MFSVCQVGTKRPVHSGPNKHIFIRQQFPSISFLARTAFWLDCLFLFCHSFLSLCRFLVLVSAQNSCHSIFWRKKKLFLHFLTQPFSGVNKHTGIAFRLKTFYLSVMKCKIHENAYNAINSTKEPMEVSLECALAGHWRGYRGAERDWSEATSITFDFTQWREMSLAGALQRWPLNANQCSAVQSQRVETNA